LERDLDLVGKLFPVALDHLHGADVDRFGVNDGFAFV
jgi:hypothetical protein